MPHSSGGGSHGGGSHGGSFGGGGGSSGPRTFRRYRPGCRTFFYYRHGMPIYVYSYSDLTTVNTKAALISSIIIPLIALVILGFVLFSAIMPPSKIDNTSKYNIVIDDRADILGDTTELEASLLAFKNKTGITPAVITVNNDAWTRNYAGLENYAYDLYVNYFSDETHWLIVYSEPTNPDSSFVAWYWEGMQGDATDDILNEPKTTEFNNEMQKNLTARTRYTVTQAITATFDYITPDIMSREVDWFSMMGVGFMFVCVLAIIVVSIIKYKTSYKTGELHEVSGGGEKAKTATCAYCGGLYVVGAHLNCPHCGAPIPPEN